MKNYTEDKKHNMFAVFKGERHGSFASRAKKVFCDLDNEIAERSKRGESPVWMRIFLSDIINQLPALDEELAKRGEHCAISLIQQPPLGLEKIAILVCFLKDAKVIRIAPDAWNISKGEESYIFESVRLNSDEASDLGGADQTIKCFETHKQLLEQFNLTIKDNTLRTWLFCRDIDRTYGGVVKGRNDFFKTCGLTRSNHFIASTGIGGYTQCPDAVLGMEFFSRFGNTGDIKYLHATDHLNATAEYGVAFERGTSFSSSAGRVSLISGTASIDSKGKCINLGKPAKQIERLLENIDALLKDDGGSLADVKAMAVYVRDAADRDDVESVINNKLPEIPVVFTHAKVCRAAWLVEAECIAIR